MAKKKKDRVTHKVEINLQYGPASDALWDVVPKSGSITKVLEAGRTPLAFNARVVTITQKIVEGTKTTTSTREKKEFIGSVKVDDLHNLLQKLFDNKEFSLDNGIILHSSVKETTSEDVKTYILTFTSGPNKPKKDEEAKEHKKEPKKKKSLAKQLKTLAEDVARNISYQAGSPGRDQSSGSDKDVEAYKNRADRIHENAAKYIELYIKKHDVEKSVAVETLKETVKKVIEKLDKKNMEPKPEEGEGTVKQVIEKLGNKNRGAKPVEVKKKQPYEVDSEALALRSDLIDKLGESSSDALDKAQETFSTSKVERVAVPTKGLTDEFDALYF